MLLLSVLVASLTANTRLLPLTNIHWTSDMNENESLRIAANRCRNEENTKWEYKRARKKENKPTIVICLASAMEHDVTGNSIGNCLSLRAAWEVASIEAANGSDGNDANSDFKISSREHLQTFSTGSLANWLSYIPFSVGQSASQPASQPVHEKTFHWQQRQHWQHWQQRQHWQQWQRMRTTSGGYFGSARRCHTGEPAIERAREREKQDSLTRFFTSFECIQMAVCP